MANPIKASDLVIDDGAIKALTDQLKALETQMEAINKKSVDLEKETKKLSVSQSTQREQIKQAAKQTDKLERAQIQLQESYSETGKKLVTLRNLRNEQNRLNKLESKLVQATKGSYDALSAQYSINRIKINKLSKEYLENTKQGRKLVEETKNLRDAMKESQEATGNNALNVGNYTESIKEAIPFVKKFDAAMKFVARNPLVAVLGILVSGLTALFKAFKQTEKGAEVLAKVSGVLSGVWSVFVGIADELAGKLIKAFEDPKQALKDFAGVLRDQIVNRFKALLDLLPALGKAFDRLFRFDVAGAKQALGEAGNAAGRFVTGLDKEGLKEFGKVIKETTEEITTTAAAFANLASAQRAARKQNRLLTKELEAITTQAELFSAAAGDTTLSFREQKEAAEAAQKAIERKAEVELAIAKNNLSIVNQEIRLRKANGEDIETLLDTQLGAFQALKTAQREYTLAVRDNAQQRREIARDVFERELDFAIDAFDTIKTVNERRLKDEALSFEQRKVILRETTRLTNEAFADQIKLTEDYLGQKLDLDKLALESDQRVIRERLRAADIDDVTFGRVLEIIRERKAAVQDLTEAEAELFASQAKAAAAAGDAIEEEIERVLERELAAADDAISKAKALRKETALDILGDALGVSDKNQQFFEDKLKSSFAAAKQELEGFAAARVALAEKASQAAEKETEAAKTALDAEISLQRQGLANRAETAREEFNIAKQNESKALREQERAERAQRRLQSAQQAANLITATSKIWAQLGFPAALPAIGVLWGSFVASKVRAAQLAKDEFAEGGFEMLAGGSHQSGRDISLGVGSNGRERRAEGGEALAIFSKKRVRKYGRELPEIVNAINRGTFEHIYSRVNNSGGVPLIVATGEKTNTGRMESELTRIREQGETKILFDGKGRKVVRYKNLKQTFL